MQFLMGLNESYVAIRDQILLINPLPTVHQTCSSVSQAKKQRSMGSLRSADQPIAMAVRCSSRRSSDRPHLHCTYCNYDFHTQDICHKLHSYLVNHPLHRQPQRSPRRSADSNEGSSRSNDAASSARTSSPSRATRNLGY